MYNEDRKLFVGGLGWDSTERHLNDYFSKYGAIESIDVKTNPNTGRSRGFAFVVFTNTDSLDQVLGSDHIINGRRVDAKRAIARTGKIFVGGLKSKISDEDIKHFFNQFGKVIDVKIPFDRERNQRKGFCFITFEEEHVVNDLLKNPQQIISGIPVDLRKATPKADVGYNTGSSRGRYQSYGDSSGRGSRYNSGYDSYSSYGNGNYNGYGYAYPGSYDGQKDESYQASRYQMY